MNTPNSPTSTEPLDPTSLLEGWGVTGDGPLFALRADGERFTPASMRAVADHTWRAGEVEVRLEGTSTPDGSRALTLHAGGIEHVEEVCLLDVDLNPGPHGIHDHAWFDTWDVPRSTTVFARYGDWSLFACYANPFGTVEIEDGTIRLSYRPAMDVDGTFTSDPLVVGRADLTGRQVRFELLRGRDVVGEVTPGYADVLTRDDPPPVLDAGEVAAVRAAVAARVPWSPPRARAAHWDWGENLFRLDPARSETVATYGRLAELCAELGVENVLVAPGDAELAAEVTEVGGGAWMEGGGPWQRIMWLGLGRDVRRGDWEPGDDLPPGVDEIVETVRRAGLGPVAYTNPQVLWEDREGWAVEADLDGAEDGYGYRWTCLAVPEAREAAVDTYVRFVRDHDLAGVSLDFVFWHPCEATDHGHEPGPASRYAQWDGYRQLLATLRDRLDDPWVEGLIGSQALMPWGARDMTHPHPNMGDNQPQWLPAWPDLSLDRAAANFQRRAAWWFRNLALTPSYKVPGQVGHQANRRNYLPVERGWDWAGARFNLLSAIASGPSSLSLCFLPCWDEDEWAGMRSRDGAFFRRWIDFAERNAELLAGLEDLFDEPRPGAVDGTVATRDDGTGWMFLVNPDHDEHTVDVPLEGDLVLRESHPQADRLWASTVTVERHTVAVLEILPEDEVELPALFGAGGRAVVDDTVEAAGATPLGEFPLPDDTFRAAGALGTGLQVVDAVGVPGAERVIEVRLPSGDMRAGIVRFASDGISPTLGPWRDAATGEEVDLEQLQGHTRLGSDWTPGSRLPGLLAQLAPPIDPRGVERRRPWADPSRLRLFPALLDPGAVEPRMWVDGDPVEMHQAYVGDLPEVKDEGETLRQVNNLLGHYVDLTDRLHAADDLTRAWRVEVELDLVWAGQLTGVHVAELPRRTTGEFEVLPFTSE